MRPKCRLPSLGAQHALRNFYSFAYVLFPLAKSSISLYSEAHRYAHACRVAAALTEVFLGDRQHLLVKFGRFSRLPLCSSSAALSLERIR